MLRWKTTAAPLVHARYTMMLDTAEFRQVLKNPSLPSGIILVNGTGDYTTVPGRQPLDTTSVEGTIKSSVLQLRTPTLRTDIRDLGARYSLTNGNAELRDIGRDCWGANLREPQRSVIWLESSRGMSSPRCTTFRWLT